MTPSWKDEEKVAEYTGRVGVWPLAERVRPSCWKRSTVR